MKVGAGPDALLVPPALESPRSPIVTGSYGGRVISWAKKRLNMTLGPWQCYALERILEHDSDGNLIAMIALLSVARQNGKSVIVRALVGWMLDEGWQVPAFESWHFILLAAHDANQARIPYDFIRRDLLSYADISGWGHSARVSDPRKAARATLRMGIEQHGVVVDVASARAGSGRGHSPGLICFDEVLTQTDFQIYTVLQPALSATHNAMMLMTSTAGFADSVVLRAQHDRLYRQATGADRPDPSFMGLWWRADDDDVGLDWEQLEKANPALKDGRLRRKAIENEWAILPRGMWIRERLNRWSDERVDAPFSIAAWGACRSKNPLHASRVAGKYVVAVDVTSTWSEGTIVIGAPRKDGKVGVEVHAHLEARPGVPLRAGDFTREIVKIVTKLDVETVVYPNSSVLAPALERMAVESHIPTQGVTTIKNQMACADFAEAVASMRLAHDDPYLDSQVAVAQRRFVGSDGAWRWMISGNPVTAVVAATLATAYAAKPVAPLQVFL